MAVAKYGLGGIGIRLVAAIAVWTAPVAGQAGVFTYHNDIGRTGQNTTETVNLARAIGPAFRGPANWGP